MSETSWRKAIEKVLREAGEPMTCGEIAERIVTLGLRKKVGATPKNTVNSRITTSIRREGAKSPFIRVERGRYGLREFEEPDAGDVADKKKVEEKLRDDEISVVKAFGMYWDRSLVDWKPQPKLLGQQSIGAETVDFYGQIGIYLLHDGREVVYVGRATDRPLGKRLYEHTQDRLRGRWDRFSWFGLLSVTEEGKLEKVAINIDESLFLQTAEAILIETVEPALNRKRGDGFSDIEYIQAKDPSLATRELIIELTKKLTS